jgi:hypothetical protein
MFDTRSFYPKGKAISFKKWYQQVDGSKAIDILQFKGEILEKWLGVGLLM